MTGKKCEQFVNLHKNHSRKITINFTVFVAKKENRAGRESISENHRKNK